jgi:hypothetical protein
MSAKTELEKFVAELSEEDAARALALLRGALPMYTRVPAQPRRLPGSLGVGDSGRSDVSARIDEILTEELGRRA